MLRNVECGHWKSVGLEVGAVGLSNPQADWSICFEEEANRIRKTCGDALRTVEHIGSTAVPRLIAKPILDIMPLLTSSSHASILINGLQKLGYAYKGEFGIRGRYYFILTHGNCKLVNLHAYPHDHTEVSRHLAFRDALRSDSDAMTRYANLKQLLARKHASDVEAYAEAKNAFIDELLTPLGYIRPG
jgi:GrpB-like predicted nucleotidyltransferase (UPF0157 family)